MRLLAPEASNHAASREQEGADTPAPVSHDAEGRVPVVEVHGWLNAAIEQSQDPYLGLKAGANTVPGDVGIIDYLLSTAATVEDALEVATRYVRLVNETLTCRLELDTVRATLRLDTCVPQPPAAEDFMLCSMITANAWLRSIPGLEISFIHAAPPDVAPYLQAFAPAKCKFAARHSGWSFPREHMRRPLERADANLHAILRAVADRMLSERPSSASSLSDRVRAIVARELAMPGLSTAWVAHRLSMSVRTLTRRLEAEQTSFYSLLDEARRSRAVNLMEDHELGVSEIAYRLGFAHAPSFHRAFRRWTGQTPSEYRRGLDLALSS